MEQLKIEGELLFEFATFDTWVNKASRMFAPYKYHFSYVCLNKNNEVCFIGEDFMKSRDEDLFPVKVYALKRVCQPKLK